jgi:hypothetical protein
MQQPFRLGRVNWDQLLQKIEARKYSWIIGEERVHTALEVLERIGTAEARRLLHQLGQGEPSEPLTQKAKAACERFAKRPVAKP